MNFSDQRCRGMFQALAVYDDVEPHAAAVNMAIDEALLESAAVPSLRFYRWRAPSASFGYFGCFADVRTEYPDRELVRRWTGGGIVPHGRDLTYSVILPHVDASRFGSSRVLYATIHGAIRRAVAADMEVTLATQTTPKVSDTCFANPVEHDLIQNGRKIAGAAQRRTRRGLLHQGSIQCERLPESFSRNLACELCSAWQPEWFTHQLLTRAEELAATKYATNAWLQRR